VAQAADDAGPADAARYLEPPFGEFSGDEVRGSPLLEAEFGMGMDVAPPRRQLVVKFGDPLDDRHRTLLFRSTQPLARGGEQVIVAANLKREE
jgi:hypothetical protein